MALDDPYAAVARGKLKLKKDSGISKKKGKKKDKKLQEHVSKALEVSAETSNESGEGATNEKKLTKTKAELAFLKQQEKMKTQRILEKASMTHKERVEKFNQHLDSLTEHFDIPKVSWTK